MKIEHFTPKDKCGALKASFQVVFDSEFGPWHVNMAFFRKDNGDTWFNYPQRSYINKEGDKKYFKESYPDQDITRDPFEEAVRSTLNSQYPGMKDINSSSQREIPKDLQF